MEFNDYQQKSRKTAIYPDLGNNHIYPTLGLMGEAGEIAEKVKKIMRDDGGLISEEKKELLSKELGDVLWYLTQLATEFNLSLDEIANQNIEKLYSRMERNQLHGSGDNR
ncbi:MAG: hypothetical protein COU51_01235 [Parcubacteria group bacterium CG10_big_fil_rev_8_21_14_0_10_36_14]|nr:MAG: hypothetical protein COU51_01235 [Parcubacteria group bacterium CG10_big_fil_rev_8_21_14_0_10_36_14]